MSVGGRPLKGNRQGKKVNSRSKFVWPAKNNNNNNKNGRV